MSETKQIVPTFISGYSDNKYPEMDGESLHNATIIKAASPTSRSQTAIVQRDGLMQQITWGGTCKWSWYSKTLKKLFVRVDNELRAYDYPTSSSYVVILVTLDSTSNRLFATDTFTGIVVSDGTFGYFIDVALNTTLITGVNWQPISSIDFVDGYVLISYKNSRFFGHSELNDTLFANGLFQYGISGSVGNIRNLAVINREVYIFCDNHTEIWYNSGGDVNAPFTKQDGRIIHAGGRSINTVVVNGVGYNAAQSDSLISIYAWSNGNIQKIGCGALENILDTAQSIRMTFWYENNRSFIGVILDETQLWSYDIETQCWATRDYKQTIIDFVKYGDKYYLDTSTAHHLIAGSSDNGAVIESYKQTSHIVANGFRLFHKLLEIDVGGDTATFVLEISDDGGNSWRNSMYSTYSNVGAYNRYRFNRLGSSRDRVYRIGWSSTNNAGIYAVYSDIEAGTR